MQPSIPHKDLLQFCYCNQRAPYWAYVFLCCLQGVSKTLNMHLNQNWAHVMWSKVQAKFWWSPLAYTKEFMIAYLWLSMTTLCVALQWCVELGGLSMLPLYLSETFQIWRTIWAPSQTKNTRFLSRCTYVSDAIPTEQPGAQRSKNRMSLEVLIYRLLAVSTYSSFLSDGLVKIS